MGRLEGKRCLIVGGTSGIGLAAARRFIAAGAQVYVAGLDNQQSCDGVQSLIGSGLQFLSGAFDARDAKQVDENIQFMVSVFGGLDVLFHVAGGSGRRDGDGSLHECTDDGWHATLDANLKTTFITNRAAIRHFLKHKQGGVILNTGSVLALRPAPRHFDAAAYTAAKAGIVAMSQYAAARYAGEGIRVNVIAPGLIDTAMAARACNDPAILAFLQTKQPLKPGPGWPEDVSDAAVFLCSEEARFITGIVLPVDGGWCVSEGQYGDIGV